VNIFIKYALVICTFVFYNCTNTTNPALSVWETLPENCTTIIKTPDLQDFLSEIKQNKIPEALQGIAEMLKNQKMIPYLNIDGQSLISISKIPEAFFSIHTKYQDSILVLNSLPNYSEETLQIEGKTIKKYTLEEQSLYSTLIDSIYIFSSSQQALTNLTNKRKTKNEYLSKIENALGDSTAVFVNHQNIVLKDELLTNEEVENNNTYWEGYSWNFSDDVFTANGILTSSNFLRSFIRELKNQEPQPILIPQALPSSTNAAIILALSNGGDILQSSSEIPAAKTLLFDTFEELAIANSKESSFLVARSLDTSLSLENLQSIISKNSDYRGVTLYDISDGSMLDPKLENIKMRNGLETIFVYENYIIGTASINEAEKYIQDLQSGQTISSLEEYKLLQNNVSTSASVELIGSGDFSALLLNDLFLAASDITQNKNIDNQLIIKQTTLNNSFASATLASTPLNKATVNTVPVKQVAEINSPKTILGTPFFFKSNTSKQPNIVFQDIDHTLHSYSLKGVKQWSRKFEHSILGEMNGLNINRRHQLAFVTKKAFYVIDNKGKDVAPFPIKFKDEVTQPLSVFDYDGKRKYRFIITQGKHVLMYASNGKIVKGFTFKKAKKTIITSPKHIRLGSKDYILITEDSGKINFLSRTGKSRISISENFKINTDGIHKKGIQFVFITKDNEEIKISQSGHISKRKLEGAGDSQLMTSKNTVAILNDNMLFINDKLIPLPFGIYTAPLAHSSNKKTYITITETQENQVYVYDTEGRLLEGFPIYGTSSAILSRTSSKKLQLLTLGSSKQVLVYEIK
jgi:hypothetical protein